MNLADVKAFLAPGPFLRDLVGPGVPVIWENQNAAKPLAPYIALKFSSQRTMGMTENVYTQIRDDHTSTPIFVAQMETRSRQQAILEIKWIGPGGMQGLQSLVNKLDMPSSLLAMGSAKVWLLMYHPVQNITALLDASVWEERAIVELLVNFSGSEIDNTVSGITTVNLEDSDTGNGFVYDKTITIT